MPIYVINIFLLTNLFIDPKESNINIHSQNLDSSILINWTPIVTYGDLFKKENQTESKFEFWS